MSVEHTLVRVITAGDVGAIQPRLGVASFDVTASVETPDELIIHLEAATPPDVILVEGSLFPTVQPIIQLAPDALIIAIGDETPTGAVGHIPAGMSGGAIASLVHALLAGGVTAAVAAVASFEPGGPVAPVKSSDVGRLVRSSSRTTIITTGAVAASLVAALAWGLTREPSVAPRDDAVPAPRTVSPATAPPVVEPAQPEPAAPRVPEREPRERSNEPADTARGGPSEPRVPAPGRDPSQETPPPSNDSREPRGKHLGWEHKPPKHEDHGEHGGWE